MSRYTIQGVLSADVANGGTFTVSFPNGTGKGNFAYAQDHRLSIGGVDLKHYDGFLAAFTTTITITNRSGGTWLAGTSYVLGLEERGERNIVDENGKNAVKRAIALPAVEINLGAPIAADADGICASQSGTASTAMTLNGALLASGRMILDVPRNVVAAWTGAAVLTVTGKDEYGNTMIESSASGTSMTGAKAFKEITSVVPSANITSATVGTGDVLGLPVYIANAMSIIGEFEDANQVNSPGVVFVPFEIEQTELLAATSEEIVSPVAGYIRALRGIIQGAVTTGGAVTVEVNTTAVDGLSITIANADAKGTRYVDVPTVRHATAAVAVGDRIEIQPDAAIDTAGQLNGFLEIETSGVRGTLVAGSTAKATATTGDVRGTYDPAVACDGAVVFRLWALLSDPTYRGPEQYDG